MYCLIINLYHEIVDEECTQLSPPWNSNPQLYLTTDNYYKYIYQQIFFFEFQVKNLFLIT